MEGVSALKPTTLSRGGGPSVWVGAGAGEGAGAGAGIGADSVRLLRGVVVLQRNPPAWPGGGR
jgi:hypothetical protein